MIDPEGYAVFARGGEFKAEEIDALLQRAIPHYLQAGTLKESTMQFDLLTDKEADTPLRFPGKVLADEQNDRLFIADSNHNRIVVTSLAGQLRQVIGSGRIGHADGTFDSAEFHHPQGMALAGDRLWIADTENHLIREIDLQQKQVRTIAGIGQQGRVAWPGAEKLSRGDQPPERWIGKPLETAINSPWALWADDSWLYIAMAGPHQIWRLALDGSEIGPYAGNGREDIVDGPLLPRTPYELGYSSFAQPSGLASDGEWLYVADSEGSSIRAVPLDASKKVRTVVGTANLPGGRLFEFGDVDGTFPKARLQHVLGITYHDHKLYVADTYNNKVKEIDLVRRRVSTLAGTGEPGSSDQPAQFDEPAGITFAQGKLFVADTNNHAVRVFDLESRRVSTLKITGLSPP